MVADLISWICRTPRRLAIAVGGTLLLVVIIGSTAFGGGNGEGDGRTATGSTSGAGPTATAARVPDATPFVSAAVRFVEQWGRIRPGETAAQWHDRVAPLATRQLSDALALTDPASLPGAGPSGEPVVRYVAERSAMVAVPLSNGSTVLVTVVADGRDWQVSDIQPDQGDAGQAP